MKASPLEPDFSHPMRQPSPITSLLLSLPLWALGLASCGSDAAPSDFPTRLASDLDLLVREPDTQAYHPGPITPNIVRDAEGRVIQMDWGSFRGPGWAAFAPGDNWGADAGPAFIEANQPSALLLLPAPARETRTLKLQLWLADGTHAGHAELDFKLNDISLKKRFAPSGEPGLFSVEVPAELWREDQNSLELISVPHPDCDAAWDTLRLGRVDYGKRRQLSFDLRQAELQLEASTGATYYVESTSAGILFLRGKSSAGGSLRVSRGAIDPATGNRALPDLEQAFELSGDFERALPLKASPGGLSFLKLIWSSDRAGALQVEDLFLREQAPSERPPIVFVSIDTLSARHMSVYGYERETTPKLAEFAEQALLFERCVANAPWTLPSYLSVMTGLYPTAHLTQVQESGSGQLNNNDYWQVALNRWTLAEGLRARGYQTAAAVDTAWLAPTWRIDQGFDLYDTSAFGPFDNPELGIKLILSNYVTYLDQIYNPSAPSFTFIHALDAHGPYWPEAPYAEAFRDELPETQSLTLAGCMPQSYGAIPTWMAQTITPAEERARAGEWPIPRELPLERIIEMYDETILKVDDQLGRMFELLKSRGLYDQAVIVISGDHGESFKHDFYSHGCLWEDIVHVPLLIKLPGGRFGGRRIEQSVQLVDLYPTLLELAGGPTQREHWHGRSLVPLMEGKASAPRATFSEGGHVVQYMLEFDGLKLIESHPGGNDANPSLLTHPRIPAGWTAENFPELAQAGMLTEEVNRALREREDFGAKVQELKRLIQGPYYELYDLRNDPGELTDLSAKRPEDLERLRQLMLLEKEKGKLARSMASTDITISISQEDRDALGKLGYGEELKED